MWTPSPTGRIRIAGDEGGEDRLMVGERALEDARRLRGDTAELHAEHVERMGHPDEEGVAGRVHDDAVELEIGDPEAERIAHQLLLELDNALQPVEVLVGQAAGRHAGDAAVDEDAEFVERLDVEGVEGDEELQWSEQVGGVERGNEGAAALARLDDAEDLQAAQGLAHARTADLEHLGKIALGRQLVARLEIARPHQVEDLLGDLLGQRIALDRREGGHLGCHDQSPSARVRIWSRLTASISTTPRVTSCQKLDTSIRVRPLLSVPRMSTASRVPQTLPRPP